MAVQLELREAARRRRNGSDAGLGHRRTVERHRSQSRLENDFY